MIALPARRLRVGFVGRVVPIKDLVTFIRACDLALRAGRPRRARHRPDGGGPRLRRALPRAGGAARPRRRDPLRRARCRPREIYGDLDVVVLTSFSEGQPLVILEAYAWGLPVIATDVGACREMIEGAPTRTAASVPAASSPASPRPRRPPRRWSGWRATLGCAGGWARPDTSG